MGGVRISVHADQRKAQLKLNKLRSEIRKGARVGVKKAAEYAKLYAKSIAPFDSGATMRAITTKGSNQYQTKIIARDGHPEKKFADGRKFNLTYWLHNKEGAQARLKGGKAKFMFLTYAYINKRFKVDMRKQFYQMAAKINKS